MPKRSKVEFTDAWVRSKAAPREGRRAAYFDARTPGLELRVAPSGTKSWAFRYRDKNRRTLRLVLGAYPAVSLKDAREAALAARRHVSTGGDPRGERRRAVGDAGAHTIETMRDLAGAYLASSAGRIRPSTIALHRQQIASHIAPKLGPLRIEEISRGDVREIINEIGAKGYKVTANRVAALIGRLFHFAASEFDLLVDNPAAGLRSTFKEVSRDRVLRDEELKALWMALDDPAVAPSYFSPQMARCLKLCALTLQRANDVVLMQFGEIDLKARIWTVPAARAKNGMEHLVPLSAEAIAVIRDQLADIGIAADPPSLNAAAKGSTPVFPSPRDGARSMTRHAVTRALARLADALGVDDVGPHDLRRTGSTNITSERIALPRFVVSAVLGHLSEMGGTTKIYDRNDYLPDKRRALDAWGALLMEIVGGGTLK